MGRKTRIAGWILSVLIAGLFLFSAAGKLFIDFPDKEKSFGELGWTVAGLKPVGVIEVIFAIAFILPRVGFLGAILLTAYLGGAVCTHMRIGQPWILPAILGVIVWIAMGMRQPTIFRLAAGSPIDSSR